MMQTNFKSVLYGIQVVLPHYKQHKRGQIIAVSSMLGRIPIAPIRSAYSAAKAAVNTRPKLQQLAARYSPQRTSVSSRGNRRSA